MKNSHPKKHSPFGYACDHCQGDFGCGKIKTALTLIDALPGNAQLNRDIAAKVERLKEELRAAGWAYPKGQAMCALAEEPTRLKEITEQLIEALTNRSSVAPEKAT